MGTELQDTQSHQESEPVTEPVNEGLYDALKHEMQHETAHIRDSRETADSSQSDLLVQKHFGGLFITLLVLVVLGLAASIVGIWLYGHH